MVTFLTSLGLEKHCKKFEEEEVDMGAVDVMEESDYAQLGVAKVGLCLVCICVCMLVCVVPGEQKMSRTEPPHKRRDSRGDVTVNHAMI